MGEKKTPQQRGYNIPVMLRIRKGVYKKAWARTLDPDKNGNVKVCYESGKVSAWNDDKVIRETHNFRPIRMKLLNNNNQDSE